MPISSLLGTSTSSFDEIVEKATAEILTTENWGLILEINDRVTQGGSKAAKDCLLSLKKRLNHRDPHVILLSLSVLDSCFCNCGRTFKQEVCTREFISELKSKATGSNTKIGERARELIQRWSEEECKSDSSLSLMPALYNELKTSSYDFPALKTPKKSATSSSTSSPSSAAEMARREEEELNKAIQLSLKEQTNKQSGQQTSLYPTAVQQSVKTHSQQRMVKALYDFEAAEDNELTFKTGELISVIDDSDQNWWKGSNFRGEGLFPASFVTADLNAEVEQPIVSSEKKKSVQFDENVKIENIEQSKIEKEEAKIDDGKLNRCLELLQNADPTGERGDPPELLQLEEQCLAMAGLIEVELGAVDRQANQLADVNLKLMDAINLYHTAMRDASNMIHSTSMAHYAVSQQQQQQPGTPGQNVMPQQNYVNVPGTGVQAAYNAMMMTQTNAGYPPS